MTELIRISPEETREKVSTGRSLLVSAYEDAEKFNRHHLEGAISFSEFKSKVSTLAKDQEIIFYCA